MFKKLRIKKDVEECDSLEMKILNCIRSDKLTESEIINKFNRVYPPRIYKFKIFYGGKTVSVDKIKEKILSLLKKGVLEKEEVVKKENVTILFCLTPKGREMLLRK